jgi:hypothetical protein
MASKSYIPRKDGTLDKGVKLGPRPFDRDSIAMAFGPGTKHAEPVARQNGQYLAGTGALVFEGEVLELPSWH